ncbi:hypothetical protein [Zwartia sp.]
MSILYAQVGMSRLVCPSWYVQVGMSKLRAKVGNHIEPRQAWRRIDLN